MCGSALVAHAAREPMALVAEADRLYDRWSQAFAFAAYEARLRGAIALWEEALPLIPPDQVPTRTQVLNRLAQAYFELAEGYLTGDKEKEQAYDKGKGYALASLRLDPEFVRVEQDQGFRAALGAARDVAAIFWYGNNLGRWMSYHYWTALTGGTRDVLAAFTRAAELDEAYWGGGPQRALANFFAQTPGFLGGDMERSQACFIRAIEVGPEFIQNYVDYAELYAKARGDQALFCRLLRTALDQAADPAVMGKWPFYNWMAVERARALLAPGRGGSPPCG
ncbi:MAG: TRAP transporter TatT component family protein [Candidatus Acetothermia bacterium]|nr:TRAP transporter TatT component family protein [Candidatus Acetothermia bacterium]